MKFDNKLNLIWKCIEMLMFKAVHNMIHPLEMILQMRALCFNNLSCIYKLNKQYEDALKALDVAIEVEESLLEKDYEDTFETISSTYINKCVILSEL
jgi:regulator of PEP synthase PpsR (kinase-PPPase family)